MLPPSAHPLLPPPGIRFRRLQVGVLLSGMMVMLAVAASSAYDAWRSYGYTVAATEREIKNVANALAEQTGWSLETVDLLLLDTARWYQAEGKSIPQEDRDAALAARTAGVQPVREVSIMDAKGEQLYRSRGFSL